MAKQEVNLDLCWKVKMNEQRAMRKKGTSLLFHRIGLLVACYSDPAFIEDCEERGVNDLDILDAELDDTACGFSTLRTVLEKYPKEADWQRHNIRDMIAEILDSQKKERIKTVPSWKERCLAAEKECERLRAELVSVKESLVIVASANSK